jgi:nicotinate-nucleotide--dimethylbenzimidazole phosphoribosyltransferase
MAGVLLAAAARRTPVIVDGVRVLAAAVVADRAASAASSWWRAASTSPDPVYELVRDRIEMARGLPLNVDRADGSAVDSTVALLAVAREH